MPSAAVEPSRSRWRSRSAWATAAMVSVFSVGLAVAGTVALALATVGESDAPPALPEPVAYGFSIVLWAAVGWVTGFVSGVLGHPRGARWVGVALVAALTVVTAAAGDSPVWTGVAAALLTAGVVAGSRVARSSAPQRHS